MRLEVVHCPVLSRSNGVKRSYLETREARALETPQEFCPSERPGCHHDTWSHREQENQEPIKELVCEAQDWVWACSAMYRLDTREPKTVRVSALRVQGHPTSLSLGFFLHKVQSLDKRPRGAFAFLIF